MPVLLPEAVAVLTVADRLTGLRADVEDHEANVTDDDAALFLVDVHTAVLDALDDHAALVDVAAWLCTPTTKARARRWLGGADTAARLAFELLLTALREATDSEGRTNP